jgi:hypothetical protein
VRGKRLDLANQIDTLNVVAREGKRELRKADEDSNAFEELGFLL